MWTVQVCIFIIFVDFDKNTMVLPAILEEFPENSGSFIA